MPIRNGNHQNKNNHLYSSYVTFLYNECKRHGATPDIDEIKQFINSPQGQKGLSQFDCVRSSPRPERLGLPKSLSQILGNKS